MDQSTMMRLERDMIKAENARYRKEIDLLVLERNAYFNEMHRLKNLLAEMGRVNVSGPWWAGPLREVPRG